MPVRFRPVAPNIGKFMNDIKIIPYPEQDMEYLRSVASVIENHDITLTQDQLFELMKIKHRWPKSSIETINQAARTSDNFYDQEQFLVFEKWKRLYDLGFTSILCNVLDLTQELRDLNEKLLEVKGSDTNANFYISNGQGTHRVSFPPHTHDYHVVVKGIYGKTVWDINGKQATLNPGEIFVLPVNTPHSVINTPEPRLSLTINVSG